jgi:hypothetical protein
MNIFCCKCKKHVEARLTNGKEIYPHRSDLYTLPFWICDACMNYVGCHHKTKNRNAPLGVISTADIRNAKVHIHNLIDPIWKSKIMRRKSLYKKIGDKLGYNYHTANIRSVDEAREVYRIAKCIIENATTKQLL